VAPMVDAVMRDMRAHLEAVARQLPEPPRGYLQGARLERSGVASLFRAAALLHRTAPWKQLDDGHLIAVDVPALGVADACLSVVGMLGESLGFLLFPSLTAQQAFVEAAEVAMDEGEEADLGTDFLVLHFTSLTELAPDVRRECARERWELASPHAYPMLERRERDGAPLPPVERDVQLATACASALTAFYLTQREALEAGEPASMTIQSEGGPSVRLTFPYEAKEGFDAKPNAGAALRPASGVGAAPRRPDVRHPVHALDERIVGRLLAYATRRFGKKLERCLRVFGPHEGVAQIALPWSVYVHELDGKPVLDWFLGEHASELSREEHRWLEAQRATWVSIWRVESAEPGRGLWVRDTLSDRHVFVSEVAASRGVAHGHHVLGRVVEHDGEFVFCGIHPRILAALPAQGVLERARRYLRARASAVAPERLLPFKTSRALLRYWEESLAELPGPPELVNTHGDPLLWTADHFTFPREHGPALAKALHAIDPEPERQRAETLFRVSSSAETDSVLLGTITLTETKLRIESNSERRADRLRTRIEALRGVRLQHVARTHADPMSHANRAPLASRPEPPPHLPPEALDMVRAFKARHYATWADEPMPALAGKAPRDAIKTQAGRRRVAALLDDMQRLEQTQPPGAAHDFSLLRKELGV
jgi:hypothetical protein